MSQSWKLASRVHREADMLDLFYDKSDYIHECLFISEKAGQMLHVRIFHYCNEIELGKMSYL